VKALLVTSRVTFVPDNYDDLVCALAQCDRIGGLLVLDNASASLAGRASGLVAAGAYRTGLWLLRNQFGRSMERRRTAFTAAGKPMWVLPTMNCEAARQIVRVGGFDLVVNARTRCIYDEQTLAAPRLGCINVHHGLLPAQRGTMCDLWALHEGQPAGFSVHWMTPEIDAGEILARVVVSDGGDRDYPAYLRASARREAVELPRVLERLAAGDAVGTANAGEAPVTHRRTPTWRQVGRFRRGGLRV
jgi:methionyl-tRNA formyltransferase